MWKTSHNAKQLGFDFQRNLLLQFQMSVKQSLKKKKWNYVNKPKWSVYLWTLFTYKCLRLKEIDQDTPEPPGVFSFSSAISVAAKWSCSSNVSWLLSGRVMLEHPPCRITSNPAIKTHSYNTKWHFSICPLKQPLCQSTNSEWIISRFISATKSSEGLTEIN